LGAQRLVPGDRVVRVGERDVRGVRPADRRHPALRVALAEHLEQVRVHEVLDGGHRQLRPRRHRRSSGLGVER
jgi:hypothetical protein